MTQSAIAAIEQRLRALEDRLAIYQAICGYGYAVDGCNAEAVADLHTEDGIYEVGDVGGFHGREAIAAITRLPQHLDLVQNGCAHWSSLPFVVIEGDRAVATCHTMVPVRSENGFVIARLSASRIELTRDHDGVWRIARRANVLLDGDPSGPALLARLHEGPQENSSD